MYDERSSIKLHEATPKWKGVRVSYIRGLGTKNIVSHGCRFDLPAAYTVNKVSCKFTEKGPGKLWPT